VGDSFRKNLKNYIGLFDGGNQHLNQQPFQDSLIKHLV